jgi:hypothetical protein
MTEMDERARFEATGFAPYAWVITRDHLAENDAGFDSEVGVSGPGRPPAPPELEARIALMRDSGIAIPGVHEFRMYDDDGELYYTGLFAGDADSEDGFGPLDDFGRPNAGATEIKYRKGSSWVGL